MNYSIKTIKLKNVEVQENGIIRNEKGYLIARLVDDVDFDSEHISGLSKPMKKFKDNMLLKEQINELANFLMKEYADEMGKTEEPTGEGAIEMAIRLLKKLKPTNNN